MLHVDHRPLARSRPVCRRSAPWDWTPPVPLRHARRLDKYPTGPDIARRAAVLAASPRQSIGANGL